MVRYSLGYPPLFPLQCPRQPSRQRIIALCRCVWLVRCWFLVLVPSTLSHSLSYSLTRSLLANISLISAPLSMFRTLRSVTRIRAPSSKLFCTSRPEPQVRMPTFHILFLLSHTHTYDMPIIRELSRSRSYTHNLYSHTHTLSHAYVNNSHTQVAESLLQIGTRRIFDHDHDMYRELCRNFYQEKVTPFEKEWEADGHVSREVWKQAGESGMLGVTVPEEYGGLGLDAKYAAVHWEEQSYALSSGVGFSLHSEIVCPYLVHYGE